MFRCTHSHTYPEDVRCAHKREPPHLATMSAEERAYRVSYDFFHSAMLRVHVHERQDLAVEPVRDRNVDVTHTLIVEARTPSNSRMHASASSRMRLINHKRSLNPQEARETESPPEPDASWFPPNCIPEMKNATIQREEAPQLNCTTLCHSGVKTERRQCRIRKLQKVSDGSYK